MWGGDWRGCPGRANSLGKGRRGMVTEQNTTRAGQLRDSRQMQGRNQKRSFDYTPRSQPKILTWVTFNNQRAQNETKTLTQVHCQRHHVLYCPRYRCPSFSQPLTLSPF